MAGGHDGVIDGDAKAEKDLRRTLYPFLFRWTSSSKKSLFWAPSLVKNTSGGGMKHTFAGRLYSKILLIVLAAMHLILFPLG